LFNVVSFIITNGVQRRSGQLYFSFAGQSPAFALLLQRHSFGGFAISSFTERKKATVSNSFFHFRSHSFKKKTGERTSPNMSAASSPVFFCKYMENIASRWLGFKPAQFFFRFLPNKLT
jgi:hypothetical protein